MPKKFSDEELLELLVPTGLLKHKLFFYLLISVQESSCWTSQKHCD